MLLNTQAWQRADVLRVPALHSRSGGREDVQVLYKRFALQWYFLPAFQYTSQLTILLVTGLLRTKVCTTSLPHPTGERTDFALISSKIYLPNIWGSHYSIQAPQKVSPRSPIHNLLFQPLQNSGLRCTGRMPTPYWSPDCCQWTALMGNWQDVWNTKGNFHSLKPRVLHNYRVQSIDSKTWRDRVATTVYNTSSPLFRILSSQTNSFLHKNHIHLGPSSQVWEENTGKADNS